MLMVRRVLLCGGMLVLLALPVAAAPDEELLGKAQGYPVGTAKDWVSDQVKVGSFSNLDKVLPYNRLAKATSPLPLGTAPSDFSLTYQLEGHSYAIGNFLDHQRITGLLIIKDSQILFEKYQYDRKPTDRFVSHSMAKSIVSLAVGLALAEGKIASLDDKVSTYAHELAGCAYGETSIRDILRMSSGVQFKEVYDGRDDLARFSRLRDTEGSIAALCAFTVREAEEGARFHYASSETVVLAVLLRAVTGKTLSEYVAERLWQPMGAEADASWIRHGDDLETANGRFNAVLRDYGRLGVLLANDGSLGGRQIVPKDYLIEATDWHRQPDVFAPGRATPGYGYGYQFWLLPSEKRRFALLGVYGQTIFVDPELKLVMVITAVAKTASVGKEPFGRERNAVWRGLVRKYGSW